MRRRDPTDRGADPGNGLPGAITVAGLSVIGCFSAGYFHPSCRKLIVLTKYAQAVDVSGTRLFELLDASCHFADVDVGVFVVRDMRDLAIEAR